MLRNRSRSHPQSFCSSSRVRPVSCRATSEGAVEDTKEFLRSVSEEASEVAGAAANALGANIPQANQASFLSRVLQKSTEPLDSAS